MVKPRAVCELPVIQYFKTQRVVSVKLLQAPHLYIVSCTLMRNRLGRPHPTVLLAYFGIGYTLVVVLIAIKLYLF